MALPHDGLDVARFMQRFVERPRRLSAHGVEPAARDIPAASKDTAADVARRRPEFSEASHGLADMATRHDAGGHVQPTEDPS